MLRDLEAAGIDAIRNDRLVRGLDYYSDTVFEFWHDTLQGAQSSLGGGGRYDGLAELLGFPATPATGYALGVERILMVARALGTVPAESSPPPTCSSAPWSPARRRRPPASRVSCATPGTRTVLDVAERRLDRKLRGAGRIGARVAVIIGENEVAEDSAVVRDLDGRSQQTVPIAELVATVTRILGGRRRDHRPHLLRHASRRATPGRAPPRSAGSTAAATTAVSSSSTCATTPASSRWSSIPTTRPRRTERRARHGSNGCCASKAS